ncbi:phosphatase domain-containing protein [Actinomycetospora sp. C-140]
MTSEPPDPSSTRRLGVVYDVDGVLRIAPLRRQWGRLRILMTRGPRDRRSLLGMQRLLRVIAESGPDVEVFFLTALPDTLHRPLRAALRHDEYPAGTALMAGRHLISGWWWGAGLDHKRAVLDRLAASRPDTSWVLVGDDAGHDPDLFAGFARDHPGRVAAIAMRHLVEVDDIDRGDSADGVDHDPPLVEAPNGEELLPRLRAVLGLDHAAGAHAVDDWFLTARERGNPATRLRPWTEGNAVALRVHGSAYYAVLAERLAATGAGDLLLVLGWRGDGDQQLGDDGPTVSEALAAAARRGARLAVLLWRSHLEAFGYHVLQNRRLAADLLGAGGEVLLDQRIRALGSHHQKLVVIRDGTHGADGDVAYVGGIDLVLGARDDIVHRGDPQSDASADEYTRSPRHDAMLELHGPVVRDLQDVFAERWEEPTPLARLPWHVVPDLVHGLPRRGRALPSPAPDPPAAGTCAVQVLRTYPRRRPPHPFAPRGERSVARAFIKALGRAQRLVYVEDQYLWSADVARVFAAALHRCPRLHLIAVVPRPERQDPGPAVLGQGEALAMVHAAGGDRVQVLDVENDDARPVYVHAKVCIVDDVWATVGSNNFNTRSWTHDSELTAAILDTERDAREPADPGGLGDGARGLARRLRLELMREHLGVPEAEDALLLDPDRAAATVRARADALDAWHAGGERGPRPPGRLRRHVPGHEQVRLTLRRRWIIDPAYRMVLDPDGRPWGARLRRTY